MNARSYRGSIARTDHSVVVTTIDLSKYHSRIQPLQKQKPRRIQVNRSSLPTNPTLQTLYQTTLQQLIMDTPAPQNATPNERWTLLQHQIKTATTATLPLAPKRTTSHPKYHIDDTISTLSKRLRQLRLILERPKSTPYPPGLLRSHYVNERTRIKHSIIKRQHHLHNARLDGIASQLDNCSKSKPAEQFTISSTTSCAKDFPILSGRPEALPSAWILLTPVRSKVLLFDIRFVDSRCQVMQIQSLR